MNNIEYIDRNSGRTKQEQPPGEFFLKFLYHHPFGELPLHLMVKRKLFSALYGSLSNSTASKQKIAPFVKKYNINMSEAEKDINDFTSFNDFFYRKLKPGSRPLAKGIVSPADGKVLAFENVSRLNEFFVKGSRFSLESFLDNQKLAEKYCNASVIIIRLAPNDYHRFHFPYDGVPAECVKINGSYFSVSPYAVSENFARVFCENKREYTILKTADKGDILISPVGATMVGAIIETFQQESMVKKGDEMGYFAFGGSSVLMLIDQDKIKIDNDLLENTGSGKETSIKMGERIGI